MRAALRRGIAVCLAVPLVVLLAIPAAHAEDTDPLPPGGAVEDGTGSPLTDRLIDAVEGGATAPAQIAEELSLPAEGGGSLSFDDAGRITATVIFAGPADAALLAQLGEIAVVERDLSPLPAATVRVAPDAMDAVQALPGVLSVSPALQAFTGADRAAVLDSVQASLPAAPQHTEASADDRCGPIPIEADAPLRADEARERFGVDGSGVTIGIISDSFEHRTSPTSWADDVASGALPGEGNPCGYTTPVEIVSDSHGGGDEGRAMAQLVHGIAPGATLLFADPGRNDLEMALNIEELASRGADIIVDDITWPQEAHFQKSFISAAADRARATYGAAYFTAAGNSTTIARTGPSAGAPMSSWETDAYRPTVCPSWVVHDAGDDCLDFDPDPAVETPYETFTIGDFEEDPQTTLNTIASIGEPVFGVTTSYELQFFEETDTEPVLLGQISSLGSIYPGLSGSVTVNGRTKVRMAMVRTEIDPAATALPAVYIGFLGGADDIDERRFMGNADASDTATDRVGASTFGHAGDGSGVSTASLQWDDPTVVREYSSLGPNILRFEAVDLMTPTPTPAPALPTPIVVDAPHVASVDGTQTTFFGGSNGDPDNPEYRFSGTSAAAPNAAAVAALAKSYAPGLAEADLTAAVIASARGTSEGGPVNPYAGVPDARVFGAGIVDAVGLIEALPALAPAPADLTLGSTSPTGMVANWAEVSAPAHSIIELFSGDAASGTPLQTSEVPPGTVSAEFANLEPNQPYSVRVSAVNGVGARNPAQATARTAPLAPSGLALAAAGTESLEVTWASGGSLDHYRISLQPAASASAARAASAAEPTVIDLPADAVSHTFTRLAAATDYTVVLEAVNADGVGTPASLDARTAAPAVAPVDPAAQAPGDARLSQTGGQSMLPVILGAVGVLLVGAIVTTVALIRGRRRRSADQAAVGGTDGLE